MIDPSKEVKTGNVNDAESLTRDKTLQAIVFGLIFGFLLQKGGVAKYNLLIGVLLLQDFTVIKMMGSAIVVGMAGMFALHRFGKVEFKLKPTKLGAAMTGGLIFGAGFGLSGYCPGTAATALGQMSWDASFVIGGLVAGSWLFALNSAWLARTVDRWGDKGRITLPDLVNTKKFPFAILFILALVSGLAALERFKP